MNSPRLPSGLKAAWVAGVIIVIVAVSGYFTGLRQTRSRVSRSADLHPVAAIPHNEEGSTNDVPQMPRYSEVDRRVVGPNAGLTFDIRQLATTVAQAPATNTTDAERSVALAARASRRAYDGAPPIVPHPIAQESSFACLACHGPGLQVKDRVASKISHPHYSNCTQCHVPGVGTQLAISTIELKQGLSENTFSGEPAPLRGSRAWEGAPPTIPHPTLMRTDCLSCHGPTGQFALRTPHTDRQSCTQCHAPDAGLNQQDFRNALPALTSFPGEQLLSEK